MFKYKYVWPYALIGLTVIVLLAINGIYLYRHIEINKTYAGIINQAGRQRMLSQKLALLTYEKRAGKDVQHELEAALIQFDNQHLALQQLRDELYTPAIRNAFITLTPIQQRLSGYYLKACYHVPDEALQDDISRGAALFLGSMEAIVNAFEINARTDLHEINEMQRTLGYLSGLILFFEIIFFIYPYHRKTVHAYRNLKQAKAEIDKLHAGAVLSIEGIQAGIWDWNIETNTQTWSRKFYELLGYLPGEITSSREMFLNTLLHPDDRPRVMQGINEHLEHDRPYALEVRVKHKDGHYRWFAVSGQAKRDENGTAVRIGGSVIDITDKINYRTKLEYDEFLLQETGDMAKVGGWELDLNTNKMIWSKTMFDVHETFYGDEQRLLNRYNSYPEAYHPLIKESLERAMNHGESFDIELEMITAKGNKKWIRSIGKPVYDANGQVVKLRGVYQDINQHKQRELEMIALKQDLQRAGQTKDKLFSIIAHDLRSPLNSLQSLMGLRDNELIDENEFKSYLQELKLVTGSVSFTLENLLQWSVTQMQGFKVKPANVNVISVVSEALGLYHASIKKKGIIVNNSCKPAHSVIADADHVSLIVRNIVNNAVKFTPYGGCINITSEVRNGFMEISIADTGVGMSAEDIAKINNAADLYSTTGTEGEKGLGLGLNFCKDMAILNDGSIAVASEKGTGTQMKITLPVSMQVDRRGALIPVTKAESQAV